MGSGTGRKLLTALQRIERLEVQIVLLNEDRMKFIEAVNGAVAQQREKSSTIEGVVNAIVEIVDKTTSAMIHMGNYRPEGWMPQPGLPTSPGTVLEVLKSHLAIRRAAQIERDKAAIVALTENGSLVVSEEITEDSLIVGEESDGKAGGPGWVQMEFSNILEEFQVLLMGKHVGDEIQLGAHKLVVKEIYTIVPKNPTPATARHESVMEKTLVGQMEVPETSGYVAQTFAEAQVPADNASDEAA